MGEVAVDVGQRIVQRRYAPKTRTGCVTCKIRRVKCDEARPSCKRCTSTGRKCDGYVTTSPSRKPSITLTVALSSESNYGPNERRCFEFFRARTGPCISGYFPDPVWDRFVLQISNTEPPVRHAIHAVAALHEDLEEHRVRGTSRAWQSVPRFAAVEYAKALKGLQGLLKRDHIHLDVILICALLMVHFESMRECFVPALLHCDNTIRLLHESTTFDARKVDPGIVRSLMRLDLQGSCYLAMRSPGMPFFTSEVDNDLPATFRDLPQARDFVYTWTSRLYHFMRNVADEHKFRNPGEVPLEELAAAHDLTQTFVNIDKLLWDYMHKPTTRLPVIEQQGLGMLRARVKMNRILAACCLYCEASIYDAFLAEFEDIMSICNWVIESDTGDRRLFSVSLDEGILSPLFYTATHCRDHRLRHQALIQLQKLPRAGVWHVEMVTRTAEIAIQFEESNCSVDAPRCHDVPEWTRVHCAGFDGWVSDEQKSEAVAHLRLRPNGMDGEWVDFSQKIGYEYHVPTDMITLFDVASPFMLDACKRQLNSEKPFSPRETRFLVWP